MNKDAITRNTEQTKGTDGRRQKWKVKEKERIPKEMYKLPRISN